MSYRIGIDIGGTFTDFALIDDRTGRIALHKQLTTPHDPSECVLDGIRVLIERERVAIGEISTIVHGTTLVTNAVIERKGSKVGMLVTEGFSDVLDMGLERRYDLYDLRLKFAEPIVARRDRREIDERMRSDGSVSAGIDIAQVREAARQLIDAGAAAIAICFLHSYANPAHEVAAAQLIRAEFPDVYVSFSSDVLPFQREFERWTTTTVNAYAQPMTDRYLSRIEQALEKLGFGGRFLIMASNGGTVTTALARRYPVRLIESGPAAGALMSAFIGRLIGRPDVLSFDMGGTTAKGALVRKGEVLKKFHLEVAREYDFKAGSGHNLQIPVVDMIEIGAGGGSIASIDDVGMLNVGPRSAGANPGPVCYARGGEDPTVTDSNVVLGHLDPGFFLGGKMSLDKPAAEEAIRLRVADPLELEQSRAAWGIHEVTNEGVARAFRIHAAELGFDYRRCSMIAFGGSGPVHAMRIAKKLHVPRVIFPAGAGVMSAIGLLVSPLSFETMRSFRTPLATLTAETLEANFRQPEEQAVGLLAEAGISAGDITIKRRVDARYIGQGYELEVELPDAEGATVVEQLPALFSRLYHEIFAQTPLDAPIEIISWKIEAIAARPRFAEDYHVAPAANGASTAGTASKTDRDVYFPEREAYVLCPVYDRYALAPGEEIRGPALIEENESTCVIGFGDVVTVDARHNLIVEIAHQQGEHANERHL